MSRRGESIYKRSDGRWEARYIHHYENNKAVYKFLYAKTYNEVKCKRNECLKNIGIDLKNIKKSSITFYDLSLIWLNEIKNNVKESTYSNYNFILRKYLYPHLKETNVSNINNETILYLVNTYKKNNLKILADKTVMDILTLLKAILNYAFNKNFMFVNCSNFKIQFKKKVKKDIIINSNQKLIENKVKKDNSRIGLGILVTLYTGIRIGELCALTFNEIDLLNKTITIKRTVERIQNIDKSKQKTKIIFNEPKTENSKRIIPIPLFLVNYIKKFKSSSECYLLTGTTKCMEPHLMYMKYKKFMKELNLDNYTFHDLRHTFATRCVNEGFDIKSLSEILGHSNISTTLSVYVHPTLDQKRKQMDKLKPYI